MKERLDATLRELSKARPVYRVSVEWDADKHPLLVSRYDRGACGKVVLADCNPHGAWLEWRHDTRAAAE